MQNSDWNDLEVASPTVVMQAARQFAEVLSGTPQFKEFEQAYYNFRQDAEAQSTIREFQKKQASLKAMLMLNAVSEEDRRELQRLQDQFSHRPSVMRYAKAQEELISISQEIGDLLSKATGLDYGSACQKGGCCG